MLSTRKAVKVSLYLGSSSAVHDASAYSHILDFLFYRGISGATVIRGIAGFGADHHLHSFGITETAEHLPMKLEFIETRETVNAILGKLEELVGTGMIEIEETTIAGCDRRRVPGSSIPAPARTVSDNSCMMQICVSDEDRWMGKPTHEVLVEALRAHDIAGVTVFRGILCDGMADRGKGPAQRNAIILSAVDTERKLQNFLPAVEQAIHEGLVLISNLEIIRCPDAGPANRGEELESVEFQKG